MGFYFLWFSVTYPWKYLIPGSIWTHGEKAGKILDGPLVVFPVFTIVNNP